MPPMVASFNVTDPVTLAVTVSPTVAVAGASVSSETVKSWGPRIGTWHV